MKKTLLLFFIAITSTISVNAQLLTESFDGTVFPPAGWTSTLISAGDGSAQGIPGGLWNRVTSSTNPTAAPHSGAGMARYNSYTFDPASKADLVTPAMNFSGVPKRVSFWMYRSATYIDEDSVTIYVNTAATATGATLLGKIIRNIGYAPIEETVGWYQYYFEIPASFNGASNYIIFRGNGEYGLNMLIDDILVADQPTCDIPTHISATGYNYAAGTATVTWTASSTASASGYEWVVNTSSTDPGTAGISVPAATANITGITPNVVNYIHVRTNCGAGSVSTWSVFPFAALPCATLTAPADAATNVRLEQIFAWDAIPGATTYLFYLGTSAGNEFLLGSTQRDSAFLGQGFLSPGQTYYWYIVPAIGGVSALRGCLEHSFTILPAAPNNTCGGALNINTTNITGNAITSTTVGASQSLDTVTCTGGVDNGVPDDDVWFEFTTGAANPPVGTLTITPTATGGITDIVAQVFATASCTTLFATPPLVPVACVDTSGGSDSEVLNLNLLSPNTHYYMRVYSFTENPNDEGAFTIVASAGNTLPVSLTTFTARRSSGVNMLNWSTQQELNTSYFVIERSSDGRNFVNIGKVAAAGNSNTVNNYTFTDLHPARGNNYYRLRTFDKDNSSKLSVIRSIRNEGIANIGFYPNPVKDKLSLNIDADKAAEGHLAITDLSGRIVYSRSVKIPQGNTILPISVNNYAAGTYILKIQLNDDIIVKKFSKQ